MENEIYTIDRKDKPLSVGQDHSEQNGSFLNQNRFNRLGSESPNESSQLLRRRMRMNLNKFQTVLGNRNLFVDILALFFGIGTWVGINSLWIQLPLLVNVLPESWYLASYLVIIIQLANVGPIFYTIVQKLCPIPDNFIIYVLLTLGVIAGWFMAFYHHVTAYFFGAERSLFFFIFVFSFSLVGCTSSVLFMPYFGRFRDIYLVTYLIGEGLSGLLPGILGLIQGVGGNGECRWVNSTETGELEKIEYFPPPRFSTQTFFLIISSLFVSSLVAFILLDQLKSVRREYVKVKISHGNNYQYDHDHDHEENATSDKKVTKVKKLSNLNSCILLVLLGTACMLTNAIVPAIMPFGTLPYDNITYHLSVTLSSIANPLACFIAVFLTGTSIRNIITLSIVSSPFVIYSLTTSVMSPAPPLMDSAFGGFLVITSWTCVVGFASYIRLKITTIFRQQGGKSLVWVGACTQIGSFIGSVIIFILVNYTGTFVSFRKCD